MMQAGDGPGFGEQGPSLGSCAPLFSQVWDDLCHVAEEVIGQTA